MKKAVVLILMAGALIGCVLGFAAAAVNRSDRSAATNSFAVSANGGRGV